jgi:hypothetical protein
LKFLISGLGVNWRFVLFVLLLFDSFLLKNFELDDALNDWRFERGKVLPCIVLTCRKKAPMNTIPLDAKFIQLTTPVVAEFGFNGLKEFVADHLSLMLQSKIDQYEAEDHLFASRFGETYESVAAKGCQNGEENFELDGALNDWRFAREGAALYRSKLKELLNA